VKLPKLILENVVGSPKEDTKSKHGFSIPAEKTRIAVDGKWDSSLYGNVVSGEPLKNHDPKVPIWTQTIKADPGNKWGMSKYAMQLGEVGEDQDLPPTDSRLRQDIYWLARGDLKKAGNEKRKIEEYQRLLRKKRETKNEPWVPRYFTYKEDGEEHQWIFNNTYWEMKT